MGTGKEHHLHEIDETRAASRDKAFEDIIKKIESAGGEIESDETYPLFTDIGMEEAEIGTERTVIFNLNKFDFKLVRKTETNRIEGSGRQKQLVPLSPPRIRMNLWRKPETALDAEWQSMDLDEMF